MSSRETLDYLKGKKEEMKTNKYRKQFDSLYKEVQQNLVNTGVIKGKIDESVRTVVQMVTMRPDGSTDFAVLPQVNRMEDGISETPRSAEAIAFSKIITAVSAIASRIPDGTTYSVNKLKSRAWYELWKRSWSLPDANGNQTLITSAQNIVTYGWGAWRVYPKTDIVDKTFNGKKIKKILFDDLFREPLHPSRAWLGLSYRADVSNGRPEIYWEIDVTKDRFARMKRDYKARSVTPDNTPDKTPSDGVSIEASLEDSQKANTSVTIGFYEDPMSNRTIIASSNTVFYDGEMLNDEVYGSVVIGHAFSKNQDDPYGVGYYELMRGNQAIYNYTNSLTTEQVEAEVSPLLFVSGVTGQGNLTYKRSSYQMNTIPAGGKVDKLNTSGNVALAINYADKQKQSIEDNTGINNIVSGASSDQTLGGTMILKEAALARLSLPRNSLKTMIEQDACISFSWFEQEQGEFREFIFSTEEEAQSFQQANQLFHVESGEVELDEFGIPTTSNTTVYASQRVPVSFDYSHTDMANSDFKDQNISELGSPSIMLSKNAIIGSVKNLESPDKIGYDKVILLVDVNSMLIPSVEIEKQSAMQLFPIIQNGITMIYGLSRQDPEQAKTQLSALKKFIDLQRQNIYDYIPKNQYDIIMQGGLAIPMPMTMDARQSDGTSVMQPQNPQEVGSPQNPMMASMQGSIGKISS